MVRTYVLIDVAVVYDGFHFPKVENFNFMIFRTSWCRQWDPKPTILYPALSAHLLCFAIIISNEINKNQRTNLTKFGNSEKNANNTQSFLDVLQPEYLWILDVSHPGNSFSSTKWFFSRRFLVIRFSRTADSFFNQGICVFQERLSWHKTMSTLSLLILSLHIKQIRH